MKLLEYQNHWLIFILWGFFFLFGLKILRRLMLEWYYIIIGHRILLLKAIFLIVLQSLLVCMIYILYDTLRGVKRDTRKPLNDHLREAFLLFFVMLLLIFVHLTFYLSLIQIEIHIHGHILCFHNHACVLGTETDNGFCWTFHWILAFLFLSIILGKTQPLHKSFNIFNVLLAFIHFSVLSVAQYQLSNLN